MSTDNLNPFPDDRAMYWRSMFLYDGFTGDLVWRDRPREHFRTNRGWKKFSSGSRGKVVGSTNSDGYLFVQVRSATDRIGKKTFVHRIIWEMHYGQIPKGIIVDHIDGDILNNRIGNLRLATPSQSSINKGTRIDNRLGVAGVRKVGGGKYVARIAMNGQRRHIGTFSTADAAKMAYEEAGLELHGQYKRS